jgi:hypothetical protein
VVGDDHFDGHHHWPHEIKRLSRRSFLESTLGYSLLPLIGSSGVDPLLAQQFDGTALGVLGQRRSDSSIWKSLRRSASQMTIFDTHEHFWHEDFRLRQ